MLLMSLDAVAQVKPVTGTTEPPSLAEKVDIITKARTPVDIPLNEPRSVDLALMNVPGIERNLTEGVTAKAYTRYVDVNNRKIGQVVLIGVEKDGKQEALNASDFTAQFDVAKPQIDTAADVLVKGDKAQLKAALERLAAKPEEKKQEQPVQAERQPQSQQGGSAQRQNDLASGYQTPSAVSITPAPEESVRVSTEGCTIRVDFAQLKAVQQSKAITSKGGTVSSESECSDSGEAYPLQRSYSVCSDDVDLEGRTAQAQFKFFYVNAGGATVEVSDCKPDPDKIFQIVEKFDGCTVSLDYQAKLATPRATLVYMDGNNREVQVRGCQASETKPASPLVATLDGCSIRHDFPNAKSYQQGTYRYELDGVTYQAGGCVDNGTIYPQSKIYTDAGGAYICQPVLDNAAKTVALQSRLRISVGGLSQYITDCTPDTSALAVQSTTDGCTDPSLWQHDMTAGRSYAQERFYFTDAGVRKYLGNCQSSTVTLNHKVQVTGYQNHDGQLFSYALTTVYIEPATGRYDIRVSEVLPGAVQVPYELQGTVDKPNGASDYQGCNAFRQTNKVENWKRPDLTSFEKLLGPGSPAGPVNVCSATLIDSRVLRTYYTQNMPGFTGDFDEYGNYLFVWQTDVYYYINKNQTKNTETGQSVGQNCTLGSHHSSPNYKVRVCSECQTANPWSAGPWYDNGYNGTGTLNSCPW